MNLKENPELIPIIEWWEKDGKQLVLWLVIAAIAVGGYYAWKNHRAQRLAASSDALVSAYTTEEMEEAVSKYASTGAAGALKIKLAKNYFDAGRFEEALSQYESFKDGEPEGFADIPKVGKAQCLEALGRFAEAKAAFEAFAAANPSNYLALTAQLGAVRTTAEAGDKAKALEALAALKESVKDDEISKARVEATETLVKRFEKK